MYACGLRISEATTLEVTAVDRANRVLHIAQEFVLVQRTARQEAVLRRMLQSSAFRLAERLSLLCVRAGI